MPGYLGVARRSLRRSIPMGSIGDDKTSMSIDDISITGGFRAPATLLGQLT